ncbi:hypothetical protein EIP86_005637 [Pleurotus ostreatoroseus]|nr:hypothetical protein EIP86_005637 [Pleurotus ostreatoroseus]
MPQDYSPARVIQSMIESTPSLSGDDCSPGAPMNSEENKSQTTQNILSALRQLSDSSQQTVPNSQSSQDSVLQPKASQLLRPNDSVIYQSKWDQLRAQAREKPADIDIWLKLVGVAEDEGNFERINDTYETLLEAYPNTPSAQIAYLNHVLESSNPTKYQYAGSLFEKYLKISPFVDLWKVYLSYVRKITANSAERDTVRKAYEFALNHIGQDKDSTEIWADYIQLLKAAQATTSWDERQKIEAVRKAYQRAVQIPMDNVKRLWEEYQEFENNLNKITANKLISNLSEAHMRARAVLSTLQDHFAKLVPPMPPPKTRSGSIFLPRPPTFNANDKALVGRWRQYVKWEESNPLKVDEKDKTQLHLRIRAVYCKAVVRMRFFAEIWYMAYMWNLSLSADQSLSEAKRKRGKEDALNLLKAGIQAIPSSFVLNFAYAEAQEANRNYEEAHNMYESFLGALRKDLQEIEDRVASANSSQSTEMANLLQGSTSSRDSQRSQESKALKSKELSDRRTEYGLAWIVYMRFARRAEHLKSARSVFGKARRDKWTPWEVFEAAALMEYHYTKATGVATRIFEKGLDNFPDEVEFALRYLSFLISINDDSNARALFERAVNNFTPDRARPIWERWARYEYQFGSLEAAQLLDKRIAESYPNDSSIKRFAERHKYFDTDAIAVRDLGFIKGHTARSTSLSCTESIALNASPLATQSPSQSQSQSQSRSSAAVKKRSSSPQPHRHESDYGAPPSKRQCTGPSSGRSYKQDRWERRRRESLGWNETERRELCRERDREDEKGVVLPQVLSRFISQLPNPANFHGPVFGLEDLMQVFRNASIPSSTGIRARTSPPRGGRPELDYNLYQGPGSDRRGRY